MVKRAFRCKMCFRTAIFTLLSSPNLVYVACLWSLELLNECLRERLHVEGLLYLHGNGVQPSVLSVLVSHGY